MNATEYLITELDSKVNELVEQLRTSDPFTPQAAYLRGKKDAYACVLCALEEGLKKEREEIECNMS